MINNLITLKFQQSMEETGIKPPDLVVIDGQYHRFPTNGKTGDTAGWYVLNDLGSVVAGAFGCWRSGVTGTWSSINEETLDKQQLHRVLDEIKRAQKLADQKKIEQHKNKRQGKQTKQAAATPTTSLCPRVGNQ